MESHGGDGTAFDGNDPWREAAAHLHALGDRVRAAYREVAGDEAPGDEEVKEALATLGKAWARLAASLTTALAEPGAREQLRRSVASVSTALAATLSELGEQFQGGRSGPLVQPAELDEELDRVKVLDVRWSLLEPDKGRISYLQGHIPGAVFVDMERDLCSPPGEGRHPLPDPRQFARTLARLGVGRHDPVVVYDDAGGSVAARLWWMLTSIGHPEVKLLDGGIDAWRRAGLPLEQGETEPEAVSYPESILFSGVVDHRSLDGRTVVDVRAPERYRGEQEPIDPKAGHIPGAINLPYPANLDQAGRFLDPSALAERYRDVPHEAVVSCGSGINACHAALAMVIAGRALPDVYIGSFSDWSRRDLPVATGPEP